MTSTPRSTAGRDAAGVNSPQWTGFYRLEYGLWHGQSAARRSLPSPRTLDSDVNALLAWWPTQQVPLADLGRRAHEIIENALEFQLTGHDDYGSGTTLATTVATITGSRVLLALLQPLLAPALPGAALGLLRASTSCSRCLRRSTARTGGGFPYRPSRPPRGRRSTRRAGRCCRNSPRSPRSPSRGTPPMTSEPPRTVFRGAARSSPQEAPAEPAGPPAGAAVVPARPGRRRRGRRGRRRGSGRGRRVLRPEHPARTLPRPRTRPR